MKNITFDKNKKGQNIMIFSALIFSVVYAVCVILSWDSAYWRKDDYIGNIFGPAKDSVKYAFSSLPNIIFTVILPMAFAMALMSMLVSLNSKKYIKAYYGFGIAFFGVPMLASVILYFIMFANCTPSIAMLYNLSFGLSLINGITFAVLMTSTCTKCYHFGTKELVGTTKYKSYQTNYVPGGYRTVKADIKDSSGRVVGSVEGKRYEEGHSYTSSSTETTKTYKCTVCGAMTSSTTSS